MKTLALCAVLVTSMWASDDAATKAAPVTATTPPPAKEGGVTGFFKALSKKTGELKDAVEGTPAKASSGTKPTEAKNAQITRSEFPIFDNDSTNEVTEERIQEVLSRCYEWGDVGPNTSGFLVVHAPVATKLDGVSTLKWRSTVEQCAEFLKERGAVSLSKGTISPGVQVLNFEGGSFAGQNVKAWQFVFFQGKLFEAKIEYYYPKNTTFRQYRATLRELEKKYGPHTGEQDLRFTYLDLDRDYAIQKRNSRGDEEKHWYFLMVLDSHFATSLVNKSAMPMARWQFPDDDTLTFWISGRFTTMLQYKCRSIEIAAEEYGKTRSSAEKDL